MCSLPVFVLCGTSRWSIEATIIYRSSSFRLSFRLQLKRLNKFKTSTAAHSPADRQRHQPPCRLERKTLHLSESETLSRLSIQHIIRSQLQLYTKASVTRHSCHMNASLARLRGTLASLYAKRLQSSGLITSKHQQCGAPMATPGSWCSSSSME